MLCSRLDGKSRLTVLILAFSVVSQASAVGDTADQLLRDVGASSGICVVLGDSSCELAVEMAGSSDLLIYVQLGNPQEVDLARRKAEAAGLDAANLQIDQGDPSRLHLADNVADAVVVADDFAGTSDAEMLRVLRPRGRVLLGGRRMLIKPVPDGMDDWSHPFHGPDNNPLSLDRHVGAPYMTQFLTGPPYGPAPQSAVGACLQGLRPCCLA